MDLKEKDPRPTDRFRRVYIIFYWLGIGTLLPWNFFISVPGYWNYKYRNANEESGDSAGNSTLTDLQLNWNPRLSVASMVPNVTFLILNAVFGHRFKTRPRLIFSLLMVILLFIFTCVMSKVNTDSWQNEFFNLTLASVVLINTFASIFQGGLMGVAGKFPPQYIGGVFSGQALGGIFASATNIAMLAFGASSLDSGFYCFVIACIFLGTSFIFYITVTTTEFYKYYDNEKVESHQVDAEGEKLMVKAPPPLPASKTKVNPLLVLQEVWIYALSVFLTFLVTLGCFPGITASVKSTGSGDWSDKFFVPVSCFLIFNVGDYAGRFLAELLQMPKSNARYAPWIILVFSALRLIFIPLFLVCNVSPDKRVHSEVVFESDVVYILLMIVFSLSNGYLSSLCMMYSPLKVKKPEEQATAASLTVACLGLGLGVGAGISNFLVLLL